jgi:hypothetical protein
MKEIPGLLEVAFSFLTFVIAYSHSLFQLHYILLQYNFVNTVTIKCG